MRRLVPPGLPEALIVVALAGLAACWLADALAALPAGALDAEPPAAFGKRSPVDSAAHPAAGPSSPT